MADKRTSSSIEIDENENRKLVAAEEDSHRLSKQPRDSTFVSVTHKAPPTLSEEQMWYTRINDSSTPLADRLRIELDKFWPDSALRVTAMLLGLPAELHRKMLSSRAAFELAYLPAYHDPLIAPDMFEVIVEQSLAAMQSS